MMTVGEQNAVREIKFAAQKFEKSVEILVQLEAMKAANREREEQGLSLAYNEEAFMKLLED